MIDSLLYLGAALVALVLCLRILRALLARPGGYLFWWGLGALLLLSATAAQASGGLMPLPRAGLQLVYLAATAASLLCLGLGMVYRAGGRVWAFLASLVWVLMTAAAVWGLSAEGGLTLARAGLKPGTGILIIRLAGLTGALLGLSAGGSFAWRAFWNSGDLRMGAHRLLALVGILTLAAGILFSVPVSRAWEQGAASLLGSLLVLFGLARWDSAGTRAPEPSDVTLQHLRLRVRLYGIVSVLVVLFGTLFVLPYLPWISGMVSDVQQNVYFQDLPDDAVGDFLVTSQGYMPLFDWYMPLQAAPRDAPVLELGQLEQVIVFQKVLFPQDEYHLYQLETGSRVPWMDSQPLARKIILEPGMLMPGSYMLIIPTNGMFGGEIYHYFRVGGPNAPVQ